MPWIVPEPQCGPAFCFRETCPRPEVCLEGEKTPFCVLSEDSTYQRFPTIFMNNHLIQVNPRLLHVCLHLPATIEYP